MGNACPGTRQIKKCSGDKISEFPHDSITTNRVSDINGRHVHEIPPAATNNKPPRQVIMQLNFMIPDQFPELFSLGRRIGQGRFGTVYLCVENATGKEYACKLIEKRKLVRDDDLRDLAREIQIMWHLAGHSNVASIKEAYEDSETVRIVMELCKGGQLLDRIKRQGNFAERKAAKIISTIVGVVEYIHSLGVMHRDLKPENFLFVNDQEDSLLKSIDFGLSTFFEPGEKFGDIVGSLYYVAPEVLRRNYGPEADIWSAGVILYIMLSGRPPFWEKTEENIFNQVLHGELDLSSDPWPFISENAKDLVRRMIDRNPVSRISAIEVLCHPWTMVNSIGLDRSLDYAGFDSIDACFHQKTQLNGT